MDFREDVLKAKSGDNAAMERLYRATYPKLRAVTASILKNEDDAEDVIQDTYIKAFSNLHMLGDPSRFDAWICRIASNRCKDFLKKHKPILFSDINNSDDENDDPFEWSIEDENPNYKPEDVVVSDDTRRQLMEIINTLPDEQRICLIYYAVEEMKISEIANILETSESTVKSRLKYAKDKMKYKIEELEKKGVKLRSLSGFALIPFLHYLFATETKAASTVSFNAVSQAVSQMANARAMSSATNAAYQGAQNVATQGMRNVATQGAKNVAFHAAKQAGAKAASGIVTKIVAGVVATTIAVGTVATVPVVVDNVKQVFENEIGNPVEPRVSDKDEEDGADPSKAIILECELCGQTRLGEVLYLDGEPGRCCYICMPFVKFIIWLFGIFIDGYDPVITNATIY